MDSRNTDTPDEPGEPTVELSESEVLAVMARARAEQEVLTAVDIQLRYLSRHPDSRKVIQAGERLHMLAGAYREMRKSSKESQIRSLD